MVNLVQVVAGAILLFAGRTVYWLLVVLTGFVIGSSLAPQLFPDQPVWVVLLVGLVVGALGAVVAILVSKLAIFIGGLLGGGYLAYSAMSMFVWHPLQPAWLPILIGAIVGGVLMLIIFDWALIILSALTGAAIISMALPLEVQARTALAVVLFAIGALVQIHLLRRR